MNASQRRSVAVSYGIFLIAGFALGLWFDRVLATILLVIGPP